jgi:hypothetical protein
MVFSVRTHQQSLTKQYVILAHLKQEVKTEHIETMSDGLQITGR